MKVISRKYTTHFLIDFCDWSYEYLRLHNYTRYLFVKYSFSGRQPNSGIIHIFILGLVTIILSFSEVLSQTNEGWKLKKDKNDIRIYTRHVEGSNIVETKVITNVEAPISQVVKILCDVESYPQWMPNVYKINILKHLDEGEQFYYIDLNAPWPIQNRDNITHLTVEKDTLSRVVNIHVNGLPNYLPEKIDKVRILYSKGLWKLTSLQNGNTEIVSTNKTNLSGSVPVWIYKIFLPGGVYKMFIDLKEYIEVRKIRTETIE